MRLAVISPVYGEFDFLKQFLDHYSAQADAILLVTNGTPDPSLEIAQAYPQVSIWSYTEADELDDCGQQEAIMARKRECIGRFDFVILPDCDGFIVPKAGGSIKSVLEQYPERQIFGTAGYQMISAPTDPPYDPAVPLVQQRKRGVPNRCYSKPKKQRDALIVKNG